MTAFRRLQRLLLNLLDKALAGVAKIPPYLLYLIAASVLVPTVWVSVSPPIVRETLMPTQVRAEQGHAFWAPMPEVPIASGFFELRSDSTDAGTESRLQLSENGRPLGPAHAPHSTIRGEGRGSYSHWNGGLYFSTSDNSDPRSNQRTYELVAPAVPADWVYFVGIGLVALVGLRVNMTVKTTTRRRIGDILRFLVEPTRERHFPWWVGAALWLAALIGGPLSLFLFWRGGSTVAMALAGFLPFSDGAGYLWCADDLVEIGQTHSWCFSRPTYTVFLASLSVLLGRDLHLILLAQSAMLALAVVIFSREISQWLGPIYGLAAGISVALFAKDFALALIMTEVLGLTLGMLSLTVLLRAGEIESPFLAFVGLALFSIAMNTRAGAVFAVPLVTVWVTWVAWRGGQSILRSFLLASGATLIGLLFHTLMVLILGGAPWESHGNFSYVLYGLSVGKDWTAILAEHPELFTNLGINEIPGSPSNGSLPSPEISRLAISNILKEPYIFIVSLIGNLFKYFEWIYLFSIRQYFSLPYAAFWWLAGLSVTAFAAWRSRRAALVVALALGEIASAPLIAGDGGPRVFAVTAPAQILPILIAVSYFLGLIGATTAASGLSSRTKSIMESDGGRPRVALAMTAIIGVFFLPAATPLRGLTRVPVEAPDSCGPRLHTVVTRLDAGGPFLTITPRASIPTTWPRRISRADLSRGLDPTHWYAESFEGLPAMQILIVRQRLKRNYGSEWPLYLPGDTELPINKELVLCVDNKKLRHLAGRPFAEIVSFREM